MESKNAPSLATKKSFTSQEIQQITVSVLEVLAYLQHLVPTIIHRDIKPENILIDENNQAYLIDFGLARVNSQDLAMSSVVAGTPGFMPPEELFNRPLTKASDLYVIKNKPVKNLTDEQRWFADIKSRCNSVEVITTMRNLPYPQTTKGIGYAASCYALAGRIDLADRVILELPDNQQVYAAEVVFNIGHPVADAGDDRSAGPIMDLVLRYWPQNYMALYHAGMSAYVLDEYPKAQTHLERFLRIYRRQDSWAKKAQSALDRMEQNIPADASFSIHH